MKEPKRPGVRVSHMIDSSETVTGELPVIETPLDFDGFYRASYPQVARALTATLGDRHLGAEAADEAMARCYAHWSSVSGYDNPGGWVYRVGLNWARSVRRKLGRRPPAPDRYYDEMPEVGDPAVTRALADLDVRLRAVVVCRFLLDWSTAETAEALGIREGTVKSRTHRALRRLEATLEDAR